MSSILNRTTAPHALRFFDTCFKHGVFDAYELGDDLGAREFLTDRRADWQFGVLGKNDEFDWQMFRFTLYRWARSAGMRTLGENFIFRLTTKGPAWCFLPYCMRFYMLGIDEWLSYPNQMGLELFKGVSKIHWNPNAGVKKFTKGDYISYLHEFAYEYREADIEKPVSEQMMEAFCQAMYDLTKGF